MTQTSEVTVRGLPRPLIILLGAAAAVITFAGIRAIEDILAPALLALVLTIAVHPLGPWLRSKGWPGWAATTSLILTTYAIILGLAVLVVISIARFAALLPTYQQQFNDAIHNLTDWLNSLGVGEKQIDAMSNSFDIGSLAGWITSLLGSMVGVASDLVFIVLLLMFMVIDATWFPVRLGSTPADKSRMVQAFSSFAHGTRRYLVVSTIFGGIVAVIDSGVLWLIGVPVPLLWGLLAFITNYIPNIGFVIGLIPPAVLGLLEGGWGMMIAVIIAYCAINFVIQSVLQPRYVGDAVGLSISLTFISVVFWAWVIGPLGALLSIPLTLLVKAVLVDADPGNSWLRPLLGDVGPPEPVGVAEDAPGDEPSPAGPVRGSPEPVTD
jgi:predicted PurR-regulated permease PerM